MRRYRPAEQPPLRVSCHYSNEPGWLDRYIRALQAFVPELRGVNDAEPEPEREPEGKEE